MEIESDWRSISEYHHLYKVRMCTKEPLRLLAVFHELELVPYTGLNFTPLGLGRPIRQTSQLGTTVRTPHLTSHDPELFTINN